MTVYTKKTLVETAEYIVSRDDTSQYSENLRQLAQIALMSMNAEPVATISSHMLDSLQKEGRRCGRVWSYDRGYPIEDHHMPLYTASPVTHGDVDTIALHIARNIMEIMNNTEDLRGGETQLLAKIQSAITSGLTR